jgi:hypothetical protein
VGFVSLISPIRDLTQWKKILDYAVNSNLVACFVTDYLGKIVMFEDGLIHMTKLPARTLSRMPVRDLRAHLGRGSAKLPISPEENEDLFARKDFLRNSDQSALTWWGFPIGNLTQPAGIFFLRLFDRMPSEHLIQSVEYPAIIQMRDKIQTAVARHLLDESDQRVLHEEVASLMEWEDPIFKKNRVLLVDGISLDDGPKPIYLQFEGPENHLRMVQENISIGDTQFFKRISEGGARPALVEHTERPYQYEIMLPLTWYVHIFGWIGIPLLSLDAWMKPVRLNFEEIVRNMGDALGEERRALGLLPTYDVHRGLFEEESFMPLMDQLILRHPPRPFVLLLIRANPAFQSTIQGVLDRSKRPSDVLAHIRDELLLLFPDQDVAKVRQLEERYMGLLERLSATNPDLALTISTFWFPSTAWTSKDIVNALYERPRIGIRPKAGEALPQKKFEDWFKRFLILKDWE